MTEMPRKVVPPPLELVKDRIEEVLPPDARQRLEAGEVALIDTRDPDRYVPAGENGEDSHSEDFAAKLAEAAGEKPALLYCNSGNRSARATDALTNEHGVEGVRSLVGGITLWNDLGLPIEGTVGADEETEEDED